MIFGTSHTSDNGLQRRGILPANKSVVGFWKLFSSSRGTRPGECRVLGVAWKNGMGLVGRFAQWLRPRFSPAGCNINIAAHCGGRTLLQLRPWVLHSLRTGILGSLAIAGPMFVMSASWALSGRRPCAFGDDRGCVSLQVVLGELAGLAAVLGLAFHHRHLYIGGKYR